MKTMAEVINTSFKTVSEDIKPLEDYITFACDEYYVPHQTAILLNQTLFQIN